MASQGIPHETVALCLGTNGVDPKTLRRHFRRELDTAVAITNANIGTNVYKAAMRGEAWACCFWLKCRAGWRETTDHRFVDEQGKDRTTFQLVVMDAGQADDPPAPGVTATVRDT